MIELEAFLRDKLLESYTGGRNFLYDTNNHSQKYTQIIRKMTIQINSPSQNIYVTTILYPSRFFGYTREQFGEEKKEKFIFWKLIQCSKSPISECECGPTGWYNADLTNKTSSLYFILRSAQNILLYY